MKNLVLPSINAYDMWDEIINSKNGDRKSRLLSLSTRIHSLYAVYDGARNNLESISSISWGSGEIEDLHHCYNSPTQALAKLKFEIENAQPSVSREICHFCGLNYVSDFDHYLSKDVFPEYSVCLFNLMPCCTVCNGKKLNVFLIGGMRQVIHLYFDPIPVERFITVEIGLNKGEPIAEFSLLYDPAISPDMFNLISRHYQRLGLLERFSQRAGNEFSLLAIAMQEHRVRNLTNAQEFLRFEEHKWRRSHSDNHWKVVLYEKLATDIHAFKTVFSRELPHLC